MIVDTLKEIIEGWSKLAVKNDETEKMAAERITICFNCDDLNKQTNKCKICGCFVPAKTRSKSSTCPSDKW